ncbi:MAG: polysaccharide ABC transporter ATP-binding protein [Prosthecobacter sp.]
MSSPAIRIENLSKLYRLGEVSTGTISHDLNRWWHRVCGKGDPYAKIGQVNDRTRKVGKPKTKEISSVTSDYVYALKDINFEVKPGEVLGIIGRNGAGKSTLLKILSRVTAPSSGSIKVRGRIASLLEVGTGFHPELTGRENIYLNGAILGMRRFEITRMLDEIVDFSGCAAYLDTPVKRYSSGMLVRLAFAVAAFLEAEILVIDEVLAVGDAEFQKKCLGKMGDVASLGRTLLFVSHNMATIQRLCGRALLLDSGTVVEAGEPALMVSRYFNLNAGGAGNTGAARWNDEDAPGDHTVKLRGLSVTAGAVPSSVTDQVLSSQPIGVLIDFEVLFHSEKLVVGFEIWTADGAPVLTSYQLDVPDQVQLQVAQGMNHWQATIPAGLLNGGQYLITACLGEHNQRWICRIDGALRFSVLSSHGESQLWRQFEARGVKRSGVVAPVLDWQIPSISIAK